MKQCSALFLAVILLFSGCASRDESSKNKESSSEKSSNKTTQKNFLTETVWRYLDYDKNGFTFTADGKYYDWNIDSNLDEYGYARIVEGGMKAYTVNNGIITFFDMNLVVTQKNATESKVQNAKFTYQLNGNLLTLSCDYGIPDFQLIRIEMTPREYALSLNIPVAKVGE